jgi:hypothetical protein
MDFQEASSLLSVGGTRYFIPSLNREMLFANVTTGVQKQISQSSYDGYDPYVSHIARIGLFDEMLLEDTKQVKSSCLTIADQVAFIAQLKKSSIETDTVLIDVKCPICRSEARIPIDLQKVIENCKTIEFKEISAEYGNVNGKVYKFILCDAKWLDLVILYNGIKHSEGMELIGSDAKTYLVFSKLCLYIKTVFIDGEEVKTKEGDIFSKLSVPERLKFFDKLPPRITVDEENPNSLCRLIVKNYNDVDLSNNLFKDAIGKANCPSCMSKMEGGITYDTFFLQ